MNENRISDYPYARWTVCLVLSAVALSVGGVEAQAQGVCEESFSGARGSSCGFFSATGCNGQYNCSWTGFSCVGTLLPCSSFGSSSQCNSQWGCSWRQCRYDRDCRTGQWCDTNRICREPECYNNSDCPSGEICVDTGANAKCVECVTNSDCPAGEICLGSGRSATCVECTSNSHCSGSEVCVNNQCRPGRAWVGMGWVGDDFSDNYMEISCGGSTSRQSTTSRTYRGYNELSRSYMLNKQCPPGLVTVRCLGEEARRVTEVFPDMRGVYKYARPIPGVWVQSWTRRDETRPYAYTFRIYSSNLSERRFSCKYND